MQGKTFVMVLSLDSSDIESFRTFSIVFCWVCFHDTVQSLYRIHLYHIRNRPLQPKPGLDRRPGLYRDSPLFFCLVVGDNIAAGVQERDRALNMVAHLQRASRVAKLQELQAQVGVLRDEIANQMALRRGAEGNQGSMRRTASPMSPFSPSRDAFQPGSGSPVNGTLPSCGPGPTLLELAEPDSDTMVPCMPLRIDQRRCERN